MVGVTRLWLVRHGATPWTEGGRFCGWSDIPLSDSGRDQVALLRPALENLEFDSITTSDLSRASESAEIAVGGAIPDGRLRELNFGELEGRTWEECHPDQQEVMRTFDGFVAPGGESVAQLESRVRDFISDLHQGEHLIFTHGGVIRLLGRLAGRNIVAKPGGLAVVAWRDERNKGEAT
ncbi:MAG TPA: histidine phosphatase family protein [Acidimicrobiia bacterium]|nr:histidine phosphatase family protein [Acidimicrobiia bacterium]